MFSIKLPKISILKRKTPKFVSNKKQSIQAEPLQRDFRCTKDLFVYAKQRCIQALNQPEPYEHVVIADTKKNKVIVEYVGNSKYCRIDGFEKLNLDKQNTVLIHGHPSSTPISPGDIYTLLNSNLTQVVAINDKGNFSLVAKSTNFDKNVDKAYKRFRNDHFDLTSEMLFHNAYELYNNATDYMLKKHTPLMGLRYCSNYDYLRK